ncbi:hypothetical protein [Nocardia sp. MW-W600-9]
MYLFGGQEQQGWILRDHPGHRVKIGTHWQPKTRGYQYLVTCECGWSTWAIAPNLAQLLGGQHAQRAAASDAD